MRYKVLTSKGIELARQALLSGSKMPDLSAHEQLVGAGDVFPEASLFALAAAIAKEQSKFDKGKLKSAEELDRSCFPLVFHALRGADQLMLGDLTFWSHFAIRHLAPTIRVRFPGKTNAAGVKKLNLDNFGLGSQKECWPYKLWVRGTLSFDESRQDPFELGRVGSVDMWTSHAHRQNFMSVRSVCHSLLEFQYPARLKGRPFLYEGEENPKKGGVPGLRSLVKRLCENWASVEFLFLSDDEAKSLVIHHAKGLHKADGKTVFA